MAQINSSSILSVFSLIRSAIKANTVLAPIFRDSNIYQYEPNHKARSFVGFPYIWVDVPASEADAPTYDNSYEERTFEVSVVIRIEWDAREKALTYSNAFIEAMNDYDDTFQLSGYYDVDVDFLGVDPNIVMDQKQIVESSFMVNFHGNVRRD